MAAATFIRASEVRELPQKPSGTAYNAVHITAQPRIMDFVTVRRSRDESGKVWDKIAAGKEIALTRNGRPFAIIFPDPTLGSGRKAARKSKH